MPFAQQYFKALSLLMWKSIDAELPNASPERKQTSPSCFFQNKLKFLCKKKKTLPSEKKKKWV
jgi:hypothetical protein